VLKRRHVFWGAALLLLFWSLCTYGATLSPSYKTCETKNTNYESQSKNSNFFHRVSVIVVCEGVFANENGSAVAAIATIALVISTIGLWLVTGTAATAAKAAAEVIPTLERPYIFVVNIELRQLALGPLASLAANPLQFIIPNGQIWFKNYGRTPAIIYGASLNLILESTLPPIPSYAPPSGGELVIGSDKDSPPQSFGLNDVTEEMSTEFQDGVRTYFLYGFVRYRDVFHKKHIYGFCAHYSLRERTWGRDGGDIYNYDREEDGN
jgi:hypothetical protein